MRLCDNLARAYNYTGQLNHVEDLDIYIELDFKNNNPGNHGTLVDDNEFVGVAIGFKKRSTPVCY
jgi:hypothetical protein